MQERFYESGSCVQKNCAILGVHPINFSPSSVQFKGEINDALPRKRHQKRHLEFCIAYLLSRGSRVRVSPGAPYLVGSDPETCVTECTGYLGNNFGRNGLSRGSSTRVRL